MPTKRKTPRQTRQKAPTSDTAPVPDVQAKPAHGTQTAESAAPGSGLFIDTLIDKRKRHLLLLLSRDIPDIIPAPRAPETETEEGHYADGTAYRLLKRAVPAPLPTKLPPTVTGLSEDVQAKASRWTGYGPGNPFYTSFAQTDVIGWWADAERIRQTRHNAPPLPAMPAPFPARSTDPNEGLNAAGIMTRWLTALEAPPKSDESPRHTSDFRSVNWFGTLYTFTKSQAACVKVLWDAWKGGTPDIDGVTVTAGAEVSHCRLIDVFRSKGKMHPAWGTMIVSGETKGAYRLNEPAADSVAKPGRKKSRKTTRKTHR